MQESTFFGYPRWYLVLGVVFVAQMLTSMGFSLVFPFLPLYVKELGSTTGLSVELLAALSISLQGFTMMLASPLWGAVADRHGRKLMAMRAMFGGAIIMGLMGVVTSAEQLILLRALQGLITGTVAANNALVAAAVPRERIGFAMGTIQVGLWGGVALGPIMGGIMADAYGFAVPHFVTGIALFLSGVMIYFGVQEDFKPQVRKQNTPRASMLEQWRHVLAANGVSFVYLLRFMDGVGRSLIVPIAPLLVVSLLPPNTEHQSIYAGAMTAVASATSTFSGVYLGRLGDRIGHRNVLTWSALAAMAMYIPQVFAGNVWHLLIFQGLAGIALGGVISAPSALLARYTTPGEEGSVYGLDNAIVAGARAVAPLIGSMVALVFGFRATFAATAILFFLVWATAYWYLPREKSLLVMPAVATGD